MDYVFITSCVCVIGGVTQRVITRITRAVRNLSFNLGLHETVGVIAKR